MFADEVVLRQNCNAGSKTLDQKGMWMRFLMWRNSDGISNLLSVPWLEENGYLVTKAYTTSGSYIHLMDIQFIFL
jgi:hypothetical protein